MMNYVTTAAVSALFMFGFAHAASVMAAPKCPGMISGTECVHKDYEINPKHAINRKKNPSKPTVVVKPKAQVKN
jgi:hypothetical protein